MKYLQHIIYGYTLCRIYNMHVCTHEQYGSKCPCPRNDSAKPSAKVLGKSILTTIGLVTCVWRKMLQSMWPHLSLHAFVQLGGFLQQRLHEWLLSTAKASGHLWTPVRWKRKIYHQLSSWYATQEDSNLKCPAIGPPWIHWNGQREVCCLQRPTPWHWSLDHIVLQLFIRFS